MPTKAQQASQPGVTTAVPFLRLAPDSRGAGMGDAGVASPADVYSIFWNPAKLVFAPGGKGASLSYAPWLQKMADNMWLSQLTGFFTLPDGKQAIGASLVYFNQGSLHLKDNTGQSAGSFTPREFAFTTTYSRKLSERFSLAASLRYVYSNLFGAMDYGLTGEPGHGLAGDVGAFFQTDPEEYRNSPVNFAFGASVSNLGTRMNYGGGRYFMPATLRIGTGLTYRFGEYGRVTWALDAHKLMVPSPPLYELSPDGRDWVMVGGKSPDRNYFSSVFGSFGDSPGGFSGEWGEVILSSGVELRPVQFLAVRSGYFRETAGQGNRKYFTAGAGIQYKGMAVDVAYLMPVRQNHPLAETIRFSLSLTPEGDGLRNPLVYNRPRSTHRPGRQNGTSGIGKGGVPYGRKTHRRYPYTGRNKGGLFTLFGKKSGPGGLKELKKEQKKRERRTRRTLRNYRRGR